MKNLPKSFPFLDIFESFLEQYSSCVTYWYVPKVRTLNDENMKVIMEIVKVIFDEFLGYIWNQETQDRILKRLIELKIVSPYEPDGTKVDRTALVRIWKKLLETLGLLWVQDDSEIVITDAGLDLLSADDKNQRFVIDGQIVKYQYPNPSLSGVYARAFTGLLPHIFLLQVLMECDQRITSIEYELFVNLAQSQDDISQILKYILSWRDLDEKDREIITEAIKDIAMPDVAIRTEPLPGIELEGGATRFNRIHLNSSYQRAFFAFPSYIGLDEGNIICHAPKQVEQLLNKILPSLKVTNFRTLEDWFAYFGDPSKKPSWLTYLVSLFEDAETVEDVKKVKTMLEKHKNLLTPSETDTIERAQVEKDIETLYFNHPSKLESDLIVSENGRQFPTPIGRIDLLCRSKEGEYVVVEIKADEARDSVFGQILRYIGWIHRNVEGARNNVRGIILAAQFPESARYSRIGLLKPNYKTFIKFKRHLLNVQDS